MRTLHVSRLAKRKRKWLFCVKNGEWCDFATDASDYIFCEFLTWNKENGGVIRPCKCFEYLFWIAPWLEWLAWHATWLTYEGKSIYAVDIRILSHLWSIYEVYLYMIHEIYAFWMFVFQTPHTVHNLTEFSTYLYRRQTFLMTINVNGQVSWPFD